MTIVQRMQHGRRRGFLAGFGGTFLCALFTVQHISARHFVVTAAHEPEFSLILDIFNVEGAAAGA